MKMKLNEMFLSHSLQGVCAELYPPIFTYIFRDLEICRISRYTQKDADTPHNSPHSSP